MLKKRNFLIMVAILLSISILFSACDDVGSKNDSIVVAQDRDATSLDPHGSNDEGSNRVRVQIFSNLVKFTEDGELVGDLAESWKNIDDKTIEFKIKENVKFHDGSDLSMEDVKFSLDRSRKTPLVSHILEDVRDIRVVEGNKIQVETYEPSATIMSKLASPAAAIMSKKVVEKSGEDIGENPIGTGPFKLAKWDPGYSIKLERFDEYFGEKAKSEEIVFKIVPEGNNRTIGLETGEIDIAYEIDPVNMSIIKDNDELEYITDDSFTVHYLGFNNQKEPFDRENIRKAIAYGIDMDDIIEVVLYDTVKKADSLLNKNVIGSGEKTYNSYDYNPDLAKELLAKEGFEDGLDLELMISDSDIRVRIAEIMQEQLRHIGVNVNVKTSEWGAFIEQVGNGEHDAFLLAATVSTGDADDPYSLLLHSDQLGQAGNRSFYVNPRVDELIEEGRMELDPVKRVKIYDTIQEIINEELPIYPLYFNNQNAGINKNIKGFKLNPAGYHFLDKVYKED